MKYNFIYKTTDLLTGKYYLGMHSTNDLNDGYMGSGKRISYLLKTYEKSRFSFEILHYLPNRELLIMKEKEVVNEEILKDPKCLNLKKGGEGGFTTQAKIKARVKQLKRSWKIKRKRPY